MAPGMLVLGEVAVLSTGVWKKGSVQPASGSGNTMQDTNLVTRWMAPAGTGSPVTSRSDAMSSLSVTRVFAIKKSFKKIIKK